MTIEGILGRKIGMTQVFEPDGSAVPVTVIEALPCTDNIGEWEVGKKVGCEIFEPGDIVDVSGATKGHGFAGVMKRHGFRGGPKTHGQSDRARAPGSIGAGTDPGRVIKGVKMAGHMGTGQATVKNLKVVRSDSAKGILMVKGAVPGNEGVLLKVRLTGRRAKR